jgi:hypothetical protein
MLHANDSILAMILKGLEKGVDVKYHEGQLWVRICRGSMAHVLRCTTRTITNHISKLVTFGLIRRKQINKDLGDYTNYYTINDGIANDTEIQSKIFPTLRKKVLTFIDNNKSNKSIRETEKNCIKVNKKCNEGLSVPKVKKTSISSPKVPNTPPTNTTVQDMLRIYNELFNKNEVMTQHKAKYLMACFQKKFCGSLEKWKEYLERIRSSLYLMSDGFSLFLNNILRYSLMDRILAGELGVRWKSSQREIRLREEERVREISDQIFDLGESLECIEARLTILRKYGSAMYESWLNNVGLKRSSGSIAPFGCNAFMRDYIKNNFRLELEVV